MNNTIETYEDVGRKAAKATRNKDAALARFHTEWKNKAIRLEHLSDRNICELAFREAYRKESGFYNQPSA